MNCAWNSFLSLLPGMVAREVDNLGREGLQELRLRADMPIEMNFGNRQVFLRGIASREDIRFVVNAASQYSPWQAQTLACGYLTAQGGHRIGVCGEGIVENGAFRGIRDPDSLCIRIARDYPGIGAPFGEIQNSLLIIGPPGSGKSTLLRDISRCIAQKACVSVVDERQELFPDGFARGKRMDVLSRCAKAEGISILIRTMGPEWVSVDEITEEADCRAVLRACNCGVRLLATAHADSVQDLEESRIYQKLMEHHVFQNILLMRTDKSVIWERKEACV